MHAEQNDLTIIGIGSSAGGLEAIRELVVTLPVDLPVSYVVVQHMSPHHKSLMTELVSRQTALEVKDVTDKTVVRANVIYVTPPNSDVVFEKGMLRLKKPSPEPASPKPSVNRFLQSIAASHGENSMAIILSGTGTDGAYGVQSIREVGGVTIAQDTETAKYDGMPQAAVQTGCVDLILTPEEIGTHLGKILKQPRDLSSFKAGYLAETPFSDLLQILLARRRVDFRDYKQSTIGRRIERRMIALGIEDKDEYTEFCRENPHAVDALFKDLLISVTRFFRDQEEFNRLNRMLPDLIENRKSEKLRVWVAGCATGEEVYSIAIMLAEALGGPSVDLKSRVQIFATDIDREALQIARDGVYPEAALDDIPSVLAGRYTFRHKDGIRLIENIRNAILFSEHNVCQDPPFQKIDLICCRNLLIYFSAQLQKKVFSRFHYAMSSDALLFLGTAESVAGSDEFFVQNKNGSHIYTKRVFVGSQQTHYHMPSPSRFPAHDSQRQEKVPTYSTDRLFFEALASSLGDRAILVADDYSIIRVFGDVTEFVQVSDASNLKMHLDLLRSPYREEARSLITIALRNGTRKTGVRHALAEGDGDTVRLDAYPIIAEEIKESAALLVFSTIKAETSEVSKVRVADTDDKFVHARIESLENEVATTREALQQTIEELETSNEELQSLNEEMQSTNEELQAANEELETSNEELQSTNEELITVNEELQVTATQLGVRTGELTSVLESTPLPLLVVDSAFQVIQATTSAMELFSLRRPIAAPHISQCALPPGYPILAPLCSEAFQMGSDVVREFNSDGDRIRLTVSPYFEEGGKIQGVTVAITVFPELAREMETILESESVHLMHRDRDGTILRMSKASADTLGVNRHEVVGKNLRDLLSPEMAEALIEQDRAFLDGDDDRPVVSLNAGTSGNGEPTWLSTGRFRFSQQDGEDPTIFFVASDISDTVKARQAAQSLVERIAALHEFSGVGYWSLDLLDNSVFWSDQVYKIHRLDRNSYEPEFESAVGFYHPDDQDAVRGAIAKAIEDHKGFEFRKRLLCGGEIVQVSSHGVVVLDANGTPERIDGFIQELQD